MTPPSRATKAPRRTASGLSPFRSLQQMAPPPTEIL
jgi:hypothetical protein